MEGTLYLQTIVFSDDPNLSPWTNPPLPCNLLLSLRGGSLQLSSRLGI
jgi:hypothetical protein